MVGFVEETSTSSMGAGAAKSPGKNILTLVAAKATRKTKTTSRGTTY